MARTRVVRLARRQGSAYAILEAVQGHVDTPYVLVVPHDCVIARPVALGALLATMAAAPPGTDAVTPICYAKLFGHSTAAYAHTLLSAYALRVRPTTHEHRDGRVALTPMLRYMDNVAVVSTRFLATDVFVPGSGVRRGTFIEDTYGKQLQMHAWLSSDDYSASPKRPPLRRRLMTLARAPKLAGSLESICSTW